jgi:hypothetical protein
LEEGILEPLSTLPKGMNPLQESNLILFGLLQEAAKTAGNSVSTLYQVRIRFGGEAGVVRIFSVCTPHILRIEPYPDIAEKSPTFILMICKLLVNDGVML